MRLTLDFKVDREVREDADDLSDPSLGDEFLELDRDGLEARPHGLHQEQVLEARNRSQLLSEPGCARSK